MRNASRLTLAVLTLVAVAAVAAHAQVNNASINATATVEQPINATGAQGLDFQNVFPGVSKTVAVTGATAGRYDVTGANSASVQLTFSLPANLAAAANLLPIGTWTGNHNTTNSPTGTGFTPSAAPTNAALSATGQLFVFIGATVTPAVNQPAGVYSAPVQMTVVYF